MGKIHDGKLNRSLYGEAKPLHEEKVYGYNPSNLPSPKWPNLKGRK
jgi:hypothetical protein